MATKPPPTEHTNTLKYIHNFLRCLASGEVPPVKDRLEYPPPESEFGLTPGKSKPTELNFTKLFLSPKTI